MTTSGIDPDLRILMLQLDDPGRDALERTIARAQAEAKQRAVATTQPQPQPRSRQRKPRIPLPDGLRIEREAAAKLGCSVKTFKGHVAAGRLKYVLVGHGTKRQRRMFSDVDINEFISNQTRKDAPCPSTRTRARRTGNSISGGEVIAFSAAPRPGPAAKPKR